MSITEINEVWKGDTIEDAADLSRSYTRHFQLLSNDPNESVINVRLALPTGAHPNDAAAYATKRTAERSELSRYVWQGEVTYEFKLTDPSAAPVDRVPKIRWTTSQVLKPIARDLDGKPCVNSAGDPFDPPIEAEFTRLTATIQFNALAVPVGVLSYAGAVSNSAVSIDGIDVAAERARILSIDIGELQEENDQEFRSITLAVECRDATDDGFDSEPLDQGYRIKGAGSKFGRLSTRISDQVGGLTMPKEHGIVTGQRIDISWNNGSNTSTGCLVGPVSGQSVPITEGSAVLPSVNTKIELKGAKTVDVLIPDEEGNMSRPSSPVLLNGSGGRLTAFGGVFLSFRTTRKTDITVFPGISSA